MNEVSKFFSLEEETNASGLNNIPEGLNNNNNDDNDGGESTFKMCTNNLPAKPSFFTKLKNIFLSEIKVELTPYEQKVEDEINDFLHQEITWEKVKNFLFQEVEITFNGKRIL